jgi:hypothetical protein
MRRNVQLIQKVYDQILQDPQSHDQSSWGKLSLEVQTDESFDPTSDTEIPFDSSKHICNTVACVAGWACVLGSPSVIKIDTRSNVFFCDYTSIEPMAKKVMQIGDGMAEFLFDGDRTHSEVLWVLGELIDGKDEDEILEEFEKVKRVPQPSPERDGD